MPFLHGENDVEKRLIMKEEVGKPASIRCIDGIMQLFKDMVRV